MMSIWKVEGFNYFEGKNLMVLGRNFAEAKKVTADHFGLKDEEIGNCFTIEFYTTL